MKMQVISEKEEILKNEKDTVNEKRIYIDETVAYIKKFNDSPCNELQLSNIVKKLISLSKKIDYDIDLLFFSYIETLSERIEDFIS